MKVTDVWFNVCAGQVHRKPNGDRDNAVLFSCGGLVNAKEIPIINDDMRQELHNLMNRDIDEINNQLRKKQEKETSKIIRIN